MRSLLWEQLLWEQLLWEQLLWEQLLWEQLFVGAASLKQIFVGAGGGESCRRKTNTEHPNKKQ
ncbi:hypothetical protein WCE41_04085, partial [Luteimonas sp. MJ246]|uniref:hypothetical protein n=1 Tax=Luteimonas sp. MJ174 TaxID=3129237 RepID=UPI0031BACA68